MLVRLVAKERLEPVDPTLPRVAILRDHELIELLVEALERDLEVLRELLLDAEAVVDRAVGDEAALPEHRIALLRLRGFVEDADAALERGARKRRADVLPHDERGARSQRPVFFV